MHRAGYKALFSPPSILLALCLFLLLPFSTFPPSSSVLFNTYYVLVCFNPLPILSFLLPPVSLSTPIDNICMPFMLPARCSKPHSPMWDSNSCSNKGNTSWLHEKVDEGGRIMLQWSLATFLHPNCWSLPQSPFLPALHPFHRSPAISTQLLTGIFMRQRNIGARKRRVLTMCLSKPPSIFPADKGISC